MRHVRQTSGTFKRARESRDEGAQARPLDFSADDEASRDR
jgi:hypothetical protein